MPGTAETQVKITAEQQQVIAQRKQRWHDFYAGNLPGRHLLVIDCDEDRPAVPEAVRSRVSSDTAPMREWAGYFFDPANRQDRVDFVLRAYQKQLDRLAIVADDTLPYISLHTGTELFPAAFGCPVERPFDDNPFSQPIIFDAEDVNKLDVPDLSVPNLAEEFAFGRACLEAVEGKPLCRMVDMQSPFGIAAMMWEKVSFFTALIDRPEAVHQLTKKAQKLLVIFLESWLKEFGPEHIAHFPHYLVETGFTTSEDECGTMSPAMFAEFCLPRLNELSQHFAGIGIHCCADSRHQWQHFQEIHKMTMLNLVRPADQLRESMSVFCDVPQWPSYGWPRDLHQTLAEIPEGTRLVIQYHCNTWEEGAALAEEFRKMMN